MPPAVGLLSRLRRVILNVKNRGDVEQRVENDREEEHFLALLTNYSSEDDTKRAAAHSKMMHSKWHHFDFQLIMAIYVSNQHIFHSDKCFS